MSVLFLQQLGCQYQCTHMYTLPFLTQLVFAIWRATLLYPGRPIYGLTSSYIEYAEEEKGVEDFE